MPTSQIASNSTPGPLHFPASPPWVIPTPCTPLAGFLAVMTRTETRIYGESLSSEQGEDDTDIAFDDEDDEDEDGLDDEAEDEEDEDEDDGA